MDQFKKPVLWRHVLFWVVYFGLLLSLITYFLPFSEALTRAFVTLIFHACIVYINIEWLFPKFFLKQKYWFYALLGFLLIVACAGLQFLLFPPFVEGFIKTVNADVRYMGRVSTGMGSIFLMSMLYALLLDFITQQQRKVQLERQQLAAELKLLRSQLNPHFLFNTLNNIYTLCHLKDDRAAPMVMKLSGLMRYLLHDSQEKKVSLARELEFLKGCIDLQKLKTDWEPNIDFQVIGSVENMKIAPLLFLPFVENLAKHSDLDTNQQAKATIRITANQSENEIHFEMEKHK